MPNQVTLTHDDISSSRFEDLNMSSSRFDNVNMSGADFENVNLSGSRFHDINFSGVTFTAAQIGGTTFRHIGPPDESREQQRPVTFEEGVLRDSVFRKIDLTNVKLIDCNTDGMTIDGVSVSELLEMYKQKKG